MVQANVHGALGAGAQNGIAPAGQQQIRRNVERRQRRGLASIHREGAPHQVKGSGDPRCERAARIACGFVLECLVFLHEHVRERITDLLSRGLWDSMLP